MFWSLFESLMMSDVLLRSIGPPPGGHDGVLFFCHGGVRSGPMDRCMHFFLAFSVCSLYDALLSCILNVLYNVKITTIQLFAANVYLNKP